MTEQELVKRCIQDVCQKNGFNDLRSMTHRDFETISNQIENSTGILISVSTVKRLLNGEFSRMPQTATLNAISTYLGFKNWQEFRSSVNNNVTVPINTVDTNQVAATNKKNRFYRLSKLKWTSAFFIIAFLAFFGFIKTSSKPSLNFAKAQFSMMKTTENAVPNTVIFKYNVDDVNADSFFIQQSWDKRRRVKIEKHKYTLTDIYYEPGYFKAKLIANDSIIKTVDVSIPTDKWFLLAKNADPNSIPNYIKDSSAFKNGFLGLDTNDLIKNQIKTDEAKTFVYEYFPGKIDVNSDNFIFKTRVRRKDVRNSNCPYILFEVFCQNYFMYFKSMPKGCASETEAQFGDYALNGKRNDLSALCYDVNNWTDIEMRVKNKVATVFINSTQVFSAPYNNSSGLIAGLGFISNGLCEVDNVELKGLDEKIVFVSEF